MWLFKGGPSFLLAVGGDPGRDAVMSLHPDVVGNWAGLENVGCSLIGFTPSSAPLKFRRIAHNFDGGQVGGPQVDGPDPVPA